MVEDDFFIRAKRDETGVEYVGLMRSAVGLFLRNLYRSPISIDFEEYKLCRALV